MAGMDLAELFEHVPFVDDLGIDVVEAADGHAEAALELEATHSSNPGGLVAHGGVTYALADTVGGAAVVSEYETVAPTIDMRIDYLSPATDDLYAEADVTRGGESVATVDVTVYSGPDPADGERERVATARGVYKTSGQGERTPWTDGVDVENLF